MYFLQAAALLPQNVIFRLGEDHLYVDRFQQNGRSEFETLFIVRKLSGFIVEKDGVLEGFR